jgi:hypothetical protein
VIVRTEKLQALKQNPEEERMVIDKYEKEWFDAFDRLMNAAKKNPEAAMELSRMGVKNFRGTTPGDSSGAGPGGSAGNTVGKPFGRKMRGESGYSVND